MEQTVVKPCFVRSAECVIIGNQMGLQLTTTYVIGRQTTTFIGANRIKDVLINEGFVSVRSPKCFALASTLWLSGLI